MVSYLKLATSEAVTHILSMIAASSNIEAELLRRVVDPQRAGWSQEAAHSILALSFTQEDLNRATQLAEKAGSGEITPEEQHEMESYRHVGRFLELIKSRARLSLKSLDAA